MPTPGTTCESYDEELLKYCHCPDGFYGVRCGRQYDSDTCSGITLHHIQVLTVFWKNFKSVDKMFTFVDNLLIDSLLPFLITG